MTQGDTAGAVGWSRVKGALGSHDSAPNRIKSPLSPPVIWGATRSLSSMSMCHQDDAGWLGDDPGCPGMTLGAPRTALGAVPGEKDAAGLLPAIGWGWMLPGGARQELGASQGR